MVIGYFGVPGCGKTTTGVAIGIKELKKRIRKRYENIYSVNVDIEGIKRITKEDFRKYRFTNSLILWDEITLDYDNRDFKTFTIEDKKAWLLHRHTGSDIIYFTQNYENVDKKIRDITNELWYMEKGKIITGITKAKQIYRVITINETSSDLVLGYRFPIWIEKIKGHTQKLIWRKKWYKYFDSFELLGLEEREEYEKRNINDNNNNININSWNKSESN